jgi:hypothetical protein
MVARGASEGGLNHPARVYEVCVNSMLLQEHQRLFERRIGYGHPLWKRTRADVRRAILMGVRQELLAWVGGTDDPVAGRVQAEASLTESMSQRDSLSRLARDGVYLLNNLADQARGALADPDRLREPELGEAGMNVMLSLDQIGVKIRWEPGRGGYRLLPPQGRGQ